ncbi:hypothetical protein HH214_14275 [Mucilaginibacter robiniae]|uniref:Glycosyltransferase family 2 protein n=1 Tax=Mucilaginibacter robiniae TaxID=2728022 RepID=A0A7L5E1N6_9SPHI|nr:hypothetical protein [Mucilaginibacter robiniae]QJD96951.1 hypothetical protein HH214_14275 [Mucilaginibacter robiniae]
MPQTVYTLLCERDVPMATVTLPKILRFLQPNQPLVIIDDGSITDKGTEMLLQLSPAIQVIKRKEREEQVLDMISQYPGCRKYRDEYGPALKLIDIPLLARTASPRFTYTDSDIIYIKNCEAYFGQQQNTYLRTDAIKLSVKLSNVFFKYRWPIPYKFNSGYFSYDTQKYDLDVIEYFVTRPDVRNNKWVHEQTCWALMFGKSGPSYSPDETQFVCRENLISPQPETRAIHLIGKLKGKLHDWSAEHYEVSGNSAQPRFNLSRNVNVIDWAQKSARRFLPIK